MFKQCQQHLCRFSLSSLPRPPGVSLSFPLFLSLSFPLSLFLASSSFSSFPLSRSFSLQSMLSLFPQASIHLFLTFTVLSFSLTPVTNIPPAFSLLPSHSLSLFPCFPLGVCICVTTIMLSSYTRGCAMYKLAWFVQAGWQYSSTICTQSTPLVDSRYLILESFCVREEWLIVG